MNLIPKLNVEQLNFFLINNESSQFLQSWQWGEFQKNLGKNVWRIGLEENNQLIAVCQVIENKLPLSKSYLYTPRGPVFQKNLNSEKKELAFKTLLKGVRDITVETKTRHEFFIRVEPAININGTNFKKLKFKKVKSVQPKDTLILDLTKSHEKLLADMHHKTRYNIRLAEKGDIKITKGNLKNFEDFWNLMRQTAKRNEFYSHPKDYYYKLLKSLEKEGDLTVKLWLAEHQNQVIATALVSYFNKTATYLHGASNYNYRSLMAPFLLHWEIIKNAKEQNFTFYDLWGIAPTQVKNEKKSWAGITRFKRGFGGKEINFVGTYDFVYNQLLYKLYNLGKKFV